MTADVTPSGGQHSSTTPGGTDAQRIPVDDLEPVMTVIGRNIEAMAQVRS